ncbi:CaiB/BaiF CoA transferase family protein [Streptomyces sp. NPDC001255]|uniref:CaiB/BaiF CoA transferase family protein n=1 Tax=Streptomyces sp. NPDC001255 TaxID=3364550 RepID=UPI003696359B
MPGPLHGTRVLEFAGMGPGPFAGLLLADLGAEIIRIDRVPAPGKNPTGPLNPVHRGRRSLAADLKSAQAVTTVLCLAETCDALIEGFRPGVMERLGLGPAECLARRPALVYGRATGWGQSGPQAHLAGHDINYLALSGALDPIGRRDTGPVPPVNLLGDYAAGGLYLALGITAALLEARASGRGQVVDAAIVDGAAHLTATLHWQRATGAWQDGRGTNTLDTGAHFYDVYETADHAYVSIGALEPQFYAELRAVLALEGPEWDDPRDRSRWPELTARLAALFRTGTREQWCARFAGHDACFAPVLSLAEAPHHPHHRARDTFTERDGVVQPRPAPRLSRTPGEIGCPPPAPGADSEAVLREAGFGAEEIAGLRAAGAIA